MRRLAPKPRYNAEISAQPVTNFSPALKLDAQNVWSNFSPTLYRIIADNADDILSLVALNFANLHH